MSKDIVAFRWTCPVCTEESTSLSTEDRPSIVGQAENALLSHVRTHEGSGHGREGDVPAEFDALEAGEHVEFDDVGVQDGFAAV